MGKGSKETTTERLGRADTAYIGGMRDQGQQTADVATQGGPWAQGLDPLTQQAINQYNQQYTAYGDLVGQWNPMAASALGFATQTGMGNIGDYMNPMLQQYYGAMDPVFAQQRAEAGRNARQAMTGPGSAFGQNSRSGLEMGQRLGDIDLAQGQLYGQAAFGSAQSAMQALLQERAMQGQLGMGLAGMGMNAMGAQNTITGQQAQMGDYRRQVGQQQAMDEYIRNQAAQQALGQGYGKDTLKSTTTEKSGDLLGDLLSVGGLAASFLLPGAGGALANMPQITGAMARSTQPTNVAPPSLGGGVNFGDTSWMNSIWGNRG